MRQLSPAQQKAARVIDRLAADGIANGFSPPSAADEAAIAALTRQELDEVNHALALLEHSRRRSRFWCHAHQVVREEVLG